MTDFKPLFISADSDDVLTAQEAGAKAFQLWQMSRLGLNVPPAFVLPVSLCRAVNAGDPAALDAVDKGLRAGVAMLERQTGRRFGDERAPLLVSVRSGAAKSMPGMLETILNVGLNGDTVRGVISVTGNPRLAWDSYRRFVQIYSEVVDGVPSPAFESAIERMLSAEGAAHEAELDSEALERLTHEFQMIRAHAFGEAIPDEPIGQLTAAARAVYRSWEGGKAREYRRLNQLDDLGGTAVTVQAMVFGNAGGASGSGVAFSRNPATGDKQLYADFLFDAQGEDVVAGRRVPGTLAVLETRLPNIARELADKVALLERESGQIQDVEFTVEEGVLYFLQTRAAKLTPRAALRSVVDFVREGLIDRATGLKRAAAIDLQRARSTHFLGRPMAVATAIPASPGVASGRTAFDSQRAKALAESGEPVILVRHDTSTDDIAGFAVAAGILTAVGGRTAHAAVAARQLGRVCLVGCGDLTIDANGRGGSIAGQPIEEGDWLSLDGDHGEVLLGRQEIVTELPEAELAEIESWRRAGAEPAALERATS